MSGGRRPAIFLDRDGTLIEERHYLSSPDQVELVPGAAEALRSLSDAGYRLVVITNQSGIARGLFDEAAYDAVRRRIDRLLETEEIRLDAVLHCPHHPEFTGPCDCRKPGIALYRRAIDELDLDAERSWLVGDRLGDVEPALALGARGVLVRTGFGEEQARLPGAARWPVADDLRGAARHILDASAQG